MKTRKNLLAAIVCITSATLGSFWYATWTDNALPIESMSTVSSCSSVGKMYLNQDNDSDGKSISKFFIVDTRIQNETNRLTNKLAEVRKKKIEIYSNVDLE